jgi:hypothetical protein
MTKENIEILKNILAKIENVRHEIIALQINLDYDDDDLEGYELIVETLDSELESDLCNAIDTVTRLIEDLE